MTNQKLKSFLNMHPDFVAKKHFNTFSMAELFGFVGLLIEIGVFRLSRETLDNLYSDDPNKSERYYSDFPLNSSFYKLFRQNYKVSNRLVISS